MVGFATGRCHDQARLVRSRDSTVCSGDSKASNKKMSTDRLAIRADLPPIACKCEASLLYSGDHLRLVLDGGKAVKAGGKDGEWERW